MGHQSWDREAPATGEPAALVPLAMDEPLWERFFSVFPLVLVGTREGAGHDIAPKHMAMPIGWENRYGFVCTPRHATYRNAEATGAFTVGFPGPDQAVEASLAAAARQGGAKPSLAALPIRPASVVDGVLVEGCIAHLECRLERIVDGFGDASLIVGRVVAAWADERALRDLDVDDADLIHAVPLFAYLQPGRMARIDRSTSFPFPADFCR
jgi:flavin reductase (DIM6/NTAB) family NADH-FMN oxidoreductase RutF